MGWLTKMSDTVGAVLNLRSFRASDPGIVRYFGGSADSHAGKLVTVNTAMQLSTVWACISLLSDTISSLPIHVHSVDSNGYAEVDRTNPLYVLLHDQPNFDMTAFEFWRCMIMNLLAHGNSYAEIVRTTRRIVALNPLRPEYMGVRRDASGDICYTYASGTGTIREIAQEDILHIKGASFDGLVGLSPISYARHTLGLAIAADESSGTTLKNGMRPSGYMKSPQVLQPAQRAQAEIMLERYKGSQNAGKVPLLEGGWEFAAISLNPVDAQLLESRQFSVEEIARWFRVPPHMVGHSNVTTWGSGLEQQNLGFLTFVLDPYLRSIEQALTKALVSAGDRSKVMVEYKRDALMRADSAGRAALYASYAQNGLRTRNEIRKLDNMPPMTGGDELTAQSNLVPLNKLGISVQPMATPTSGIVDTIKQ